MSCAFCKVNSVSSYGGWCPVSCFYFWRCKIESFNVVEYKYRSRGIYLYSGCVHLFETSLYPNRAYSSISGYHHHLSFYKLSSTIKMKLVISSETKVVGPSWPVKGEKITHERAVVYCAYILSKTNFPTRL